MISDDRAEKAVEFTRDHADLRGSLKGQIAYLDHAIKIALAQAFLEAEGTVGERDARSRTDAGYQAKVIEQRDAITELHTIETKLKAVSPQQNVNAMWGFGIKLKFMFQNVVRSRGTVRSRSGLTFRCATFLSPPIPHTA